VAPALLVQVGMRVLIAEDTESVRFALRMAIESMGHEVVGLATDGEEALRSYFETKPECVLMDVRMPRLDGLACTRQLMNRDPNGRVIIVTGGRTTQHEASAAGACGFIEKPFDLGQLDRMIAGQP
jgi:DNA-binding NtrC family response regulator